MFCKSCGKEISENSKFCPFCETSRGEVAAQPEAEVEAQPVVKPAPKPVAPPVPQIYINQTTPQTSQQIPSQYTPISMWGYFGYEILFCIPFVGFVCLIVFALSDSNINRRNFARSYFCGLIIALVILLIVFILSLITGASIGILSNM